MAPHLPLLCRFPRLNPSFRGFFDVETVRRRGLDGFEFDGGFGGGGGCGGEAAGGGGG